MSDPSENLHSSVSRFEMLVQSVTDYAIYMLDPTGKVTSWNAGARRFKGYEADEIIGEHFSKFYTPEERGTIPKIASTTRGRPRQRHGKYRPWCLHRERAQRSDSAKDGRA